MQSSGDGLRTEIRNEIRSLLRDTRGRATSVQAPARALADRAPDAPAAPLALPAIPQGGGRIIIDKQGNRTTVTTAALPADVLLLARRAEETAFGLMGLLAVIIIVGPFARMAARRMERRPEVDAVNTNARVLQEQIQQLQQGMDAMSLEMERVGEAQRFQSKLLLKKDGVQQL